MDFFQLLILFTVMLLIGFEPAFSGKLLKKLNKELKKVNNPFFLIMCIVIKSFSYIQMNYQIFDQKFFADIGKNAVDIEALNVSLFWFLIKETIVSKQNTSTILDF